MIRTLRASAAVLAIAMAPAWADAPAPQPSELQDRLARLSPESPLAYFELAEHIIETSPAPQSLALARTLLVLAFETSRQEPGHERLGASAALALAAIATSDQEKNALLAIAAAEAAAHHTPRLRLLPAPSPSDAAPEQRLVGWQLATALGLARSGEGREARDLLRKPPVSAAADALSAESPIVRRLLEDATDSPSCPSCRNKRLERPASGAQASPPALCTLCQGNPGPRLSEAELSAVLAAEARVLRAQALTWSGQLLLDGATPLREFGAESLAARLGVDPAAVYWLPDPSAAFPGGRWSPTPARP